MKAFTKLVSIFALVSAVASLHGKEDGLAPGDAYPVVVRQTPPEYPKEMKEKKVRGEATVEFIVEVDGTVRIATIVKQTNEAFGKAALACVKKWVFKPGLKAGVPVRCRMAIPIVFQL